MQRELNSGHMTTSEHTTCLVDRDVCVAAELRFCPLLHIDSTKRAITHCPVYSIFLTVCVDDNSCNSRQIEVRSC